MLKEYITHVVRSLEACGPMTRRDLSEIMDITEQEFDELFGSPAVSPKLSVDHIEALTRFFGGDLFRDSFIAQVGSYEDCSGVRSRRVRITTNDLTNSLSATANQMFKGHYSSYGRDSAATSAATAVAAVRGFASMIEGCKNLADVVGYAEEGGVQENEENEESEVQETATA